MPFRGCELATLAALLVVSLGSGSLGEAQALSAQPAVDQHRLVAELTGWGPEGQTPPLLPVHTRGARRGGVLPLGDAGGAGTGGAAPPVPPPAQQRALDLLLPPFEGVNVVAEIPATISSTEHVVLGAHYDSQGGPGAVDNASGVAVVVGIAAQVAALECRARSFLFVLFDQEEDARMAGSRAFARHLADAALDIHSVHNVDLAGWDEDGDHGVVIQSTSPSRITRLYRNVAADLSLRVRVVAGASSDAKSFVDEGFRTVGVYQENVGDGTASFIHTPLDTYEKVDFNLLTKMTDLVAETMKGLAVPTSEPGYR